MQYIWGLHTRFRFALWNPLRKPHVTWQQGVGICRSNFPPRSKERAALILDHVPMLILLPIPISHLLGHFLPRMPTNPQSHKLIRITPISSTYGRMEPFGEGDKTGGQSTYRLLPPVLVRHRSTPPPFSRTAINYIGRRSLSAPVPVPHNVIPPRTSLLPPPRRTFLLPTAAIADNQHTPTCSVLPHAHVA